MVKRALTAVPVAVVLPAVLLLAGCAGGADGSDGADTGSSLSADEQEAADNLAAQIVRSGTGSGQGSDEDAVTEQQARCIAEGAVAEVGLAELQDYGIVTDDLLVNKDIQGVTMSSTDADALAGVFVDCIDAEGLFEKQYIAAAGDSAKVQECIESAVDEEGVRDTLSSSFQGERTPAAVRLEEKVSACAREKGADE